MYKRYHFSWVCLKYRKPQFKWFLSIHHHENNWETSVNKLIMPKSIIEFFKKHLKVKSSAQEAEEDKNAIQLAAAIVMLELTQARIDCEPKDREIIIEELFNYFYLTRETAAILESKAEQADKKLTSLFPYTHLLKENYDGQSKQHLIRALWDIAYQIDFVDKYEEAYLHKIANLLHIPHSQLIHSKQTVEQKYKAQNN